jgi:adenylosuccinate lyase
MPHKDMKGGNRTKEEQDVSVANKLMGWMTTALANCEMPYARSLYASANSRIDFEDGFKFIDHGVRELSAVVFYLGVNTDRSKERVTRTLGVVTSPQVMTYLTDPRFVEQPMARSEAHDLIGRIATMAWEGRISFVELLLKSGEVSKRLSEATLREITDPFRYIGQSREIIQAVANDCYQRKTLEEAKK